MARVNELDRVITAFTKLPIIGSKTALRLGIWLIGKHALIEELIDALEALKNARTCSSCNAPSSGNVCEICSDNTRDQTTLCVVEKYTDILNIERTKTYPGLYFCLGSLWFPARGVHKEHLPLDKLKSRILDLKPQEVILALPFTLQGDATASLLAKIVRENITDVKITRPARGLPKGAEIDQADDYSLSYALKHRYKDE